MRSKRWSLIALAIAAFLLTLVIFLPATLIAKGLPANVSTGALGGSLWNGTADALTIDGRLLGAAHWRVRPSHLFRGRLAVDAAVTRSDGSMRGRFAFGLGRKLGVTNLEARWPLSELPARALPRGWSGDLQVTAPTLQFDGGGLTLAEGTIEVRNLRQPRRSDMGIGSYRLTFDESARQGDKLVGRLQDLGGPMAVMGTITLGPDRTYVLNGLVAARPGASPAIAEELRFLGAPDAQGRRPFGLEGDY